MTYTIKQSSTEAALLFFLVQSSDHITGLTGATATVTLSKNGAAFASPSGAVSEIANGWYKVAANATDTNTLGPLALHATAASGDPCDIVVANIVAYDPQDAVHLGLSAIPNATAGAANGLLIAGTNAATTIDGLTLTGTAASGSTPATAGLTVTGGAASTTGGGTAAAAIIATGGAGAASTNGAAAGATFTAGGTTTVSGNDGMIWTGTGNGNGLTLTHAGTGKDLNAQTTNALQVNATTVGDKTGYSLTQTFPTNFSALSITAGGHISNVDTLTTYTGDTPQTGDVYALMNSSTTEPTSVPASTASRAVKIDYLFTKTRNKSTQTATTQLVRNNADNATIATVTVSDDGTTFTKGVDT